MNIIADLHTHTKGSDTLDRTLLLMTGVAKERGLSYLAFTDHAPITSNHYTSWDNKEWEGVPKEIQGVRLLRGVEADILDFKGSLGIPSDTLKSLDIVLAALHKYCIQPSERIAHTEAYEAILCNPYVDILAHPGETAFPFDEAYIMKLAAKEGKAIEITALSHKNDPDSIKNERNLVQLAMKYGTLLAISSDAQNPSNIGNFDTIPLMLSEFNVPKELVINSSVGGLEHFLNVRKLSKSQ